MSDITSITPSFFTKYQFWILLLIALICRNIPLISLPFNWLESYFHEISHGIAAVLSGGKIIQIELFLDGAGLCTTQGGIRFFTSFMGYTGAALWGAAVYRLASVHYKTAKVLCGFIILLLVVSCLLWVRDLLTFFIISVLIMLFLLKFKLDGNLVFQRILQLIGLTVLLNAVMSPLYLLDGKTQGDGATLANVTYIPELVWVVIWMIIGVLLLIYSAKIKYKNGVSV
jgi:peptidase M50B-like protein